MSSTREIMRTIMGRETGASAKTIGQLVARYLKSLEKFTASTRAVSAVPFVPASRAVLPTEAEDLSPRCRRR